MSSISTLIRCSIALALSIVCTTISVAAQSELRDSPLVQFGFSELATPELDDATLGTRAFH